MTMKRVEEANNDEGWDYGDIWKNGSADESLADSDTEYIEVLRADTGRGFDDSVMLDLVAYLGSRGIRATSDSFSLGMEPAAIKNYVLKVEVGKEQEALDLLKEKFIAGNHSA